MPLTGSAACCIPRSHGSSSLQVSSSHFAIVVEDDNPVWLPDASCQPVARVLEAAEDIILDIQLYGFFNNPPDRNAALDFPSIQVISNVSEPPNPLCCSGSYKFSGTATVGLGTNFLLVNGGWQPVISMASGTWQRWRLLYSGMQGTIALQIIDPKTNAAAAQCEMMLIAKDGVYLLKVSVREWVGVGMRLLQLLCAWPAAPRAASCRRGPPPPAPAKMPYSLAPRPTLHVCACTPQIPRPIPAPLLPSGGRAELFVRCSGEHGARYVITTRNQGNPFIDMNTQAVSSSGGAHLHWAARMQPCGLGLPRPLRRACSRGPFLRPAHALCVHVRPPPPLAAHVDPAGRAGDHRP